MPLHRPASEISSRIAERAAGFVGEGRALTVVALASETGIEPERLRALYPDDADLAFAAVEGGFARLASAIGAIPADLGDSSRLAELGRAYIRFALSNRSLFLLMFDPVHGPRRPDAGTDGGYLSALEIVADAAWVPSRSEPARLAMLQVWSMVHGYAMLAIAGALPGDAHGDPVIDELIESSVRRIAA